MNSLLRHVLALWLLLTVTFVAALLVARLNRTPDALQALGFDLCNGVPCFKGIKLGMDWEGAQKVASYAVIENSYLEFPINVPNEESITIRPSNTKQWITVIDFYNIRKANRPLLKISEIIAHYGPPHCLGLLTTEGKIFLFYSGFGVFVYGSPDPVHFRLEANHPAYGFFVDSTDPQITCNPVWPGQTVFSPWRGFTSAEVYESRSRRDSAIPQP
jgi:hypothetical protein